MEHCTVGLTNLYKSFPSDDFDDDLGDDESSPSASARDSDDAYFPDDLITIPDSESRKDKTKKARPLPPPPFQAKVVKLAKEDAPACDDDGATARVVEKIMKCRTVAFHETSTEKEASNALREMSRLMKKHHIHEGHLFAKAVDPNGEVKPGGSKVEIALYPGGKRKCVFKEAWAGDLCTAIITFFDTKAYSQVYKYKNSIVWVFYGIAENSRVAAEAFESVYNLIHDWARSRRYDEKKSYCLGVVKGLRRTARAQKAQEKLEAEQRDEAAHAESDRIAALRRQMEVDRLKDPSEQNVIPKPQAPTYNDVVDETATQGLDGRFVDASSPADVEMDWSGPDYDSESDSEPRFSDDSDTEDVGTDEDEEIGGYGDDAEIQKEDCFTDAPTHKDQDDKPLLPFKTEQEVKSERKDEEKDCIVDPHISNGELAALTRYTDIAGKAANDYLSSRNIKFRKGRKTDFTVRVRAAYEAGIHDSRDIDVKRKRIKRE